MRAKTDVFGAEGLILAQQHEFVGQQADVLAGKDGVAGGGNSCGVLIVPNFIRRDQRGAVGGAGVAAEDALVGFAFDVAEVGL